LVYLASDYSLIAIEESRLSIDYERARYYELIRELNSSRNELTPISALPPELLGRIFTFVVAGRFRDTSGAVDMAATFSFIHVSRKWRYIALDTPGLWTTPRLLLPDMGKSHAGAIKNGRFSGLF
jgi:hypothetical protein